MTVLLDESKPAEAKPTVVMSTLPWWTWVLPFFIANIGTWLSLWFQTGPGASLWYLPTAFGIVMAYWWGPRVLLGIYLNAVVCAPLWDLPWQWSFLYALPETLEVGLSWFLFIRMVEGKSWLPDLTNVGRFLLFGSLGPTVIANAYLVLQLYLLGNIPENAIWANWQILFSADLATQFVFAVPVLVLFTKPVSERGWTQTKYEIPKLQFLRGNRNSALDVLLITVIFIVSLILILLFSIHDLWILYGLLMIFIAIRYGVNMAVIGASWIGILAFLLPPILTGQPGSAIGTDSQVLATNFDILFLCGLTLVSGRAISDLSTEIAERSQSEQNLRRTETKYRILVEQIPPIVYMAALEQHLGVTYISPQIEILGFTPDEWTADPELWLRQIHPDDRQKVMSDLEQSTNSGQPFRSEYRLIALDGKARWFLDEAVDVRDRDGSALFRQGFMLDITARKNAEESLSSREQYLELLNDMTRAILLSKDFDSTLQILSSDMAKLIHADDCYIARWDEGRQTVVPVAATIGPEGSRPSYRDTRSEDLKMAVAVLDARHALAADDVYNSPYINVELAKKLRAHSALGIPLIAGEHKLGAAIIAFNTPHHFTSDEIQRAEQAGNQVALALWNFQQSMEIQQRLRESNALANIERALSESERIGTGGVLQLIVDSARELMPHAEKSVIHLLEVEEQVLFASAVSGFADQEKEYKRVKMHLGEGVAGQVIREGITINIADINSYPRFLISDSKPTFRSLLVAPVQSGGQQIGTISVQSAAVNAFSSKDAELLNALAVQAAIAIENTRLFETTQQSLREVNALYRISQELATSLDPDELIKDVVTLLQKNFQYYHVQIFFVEPATGDLLLRSGSGTIGDQLLQQRFRLPQGFGITGHVSETATPFFTNNVNSVIFFDRNPLLPDTQSELAVPIKVEGKVLGVLDIQQTGSRGLTDGDLQLMTAVADQLSVSLQKANLYTNLQTALQQEQTIRSQLIQSERLALVGRLLASVSHELNNPLQAIQNALFLLKDEANLSDQARQDLDVILAEAERMAALIERLRSAYRPVRIKDFRPVDLNNLIEDVHALISTHMRQKQIAFEFFPDSELLKVSGLSDQLRQVVLNLFLNAIEVMKPGGRLTVLTSSLPLQNEVLLTVKDTGPGIDPDILPLIFEPFITNKNAGTGLGLTITHDIIEQHHGRIEAENNPNSQNGAVFNIWLPVHEGNGK
jgi:PAS domain S-box-containing protein